MKTILYFGREKGQTDPLKLFGALTLSLTTQIIMTLSTMTHSISALSIMALRIMAQRTIVIRLTITKLVHLDNYNKRCVDTTRSGF